MDWNGIWEKVKIENVKHYKKDPHAVKSDRVEVTISMPIEVYSTLRVQFDAHHTLSTRRTTDKDQNACTASNTVPKT